MKYNDFKDMRTKILRLHSSLFQWNTIMNVVKFISNFLYNTKNTNKVYDSEKQKTQSIASIK